jgi:pimeloyl-ACP methyl ester carboxylesterase
MTIQREEQIVRSADGTRVGFVKLGSGPALVLVHGALNSGEHWLPVAAAIAEQFTCYVMDRRGRGRSGDGLQYSFDLECADIDAVLEAAGPGAHLLGHSSGVIYVLEIACRVPVGRLVLYEPPLNYRGPEAELIVKRIRTAVKSNQLDEALTLFVKDALRLPEEVVSALRVAPLWKEMTTHTPTFVREWEAIFQLNPSVEWYSDVTVPTLPLSGTDSADHALCATAALHETLPNVRVALLDGQGHTANLAVADVVASRVSEFLLGTP